MNHESTCKYHLSHDSNKITMIAECKECEGEATLSQKTCFTGILNNLCQEFNVDDVVLSHYIETKYTSSSMQMLRMMVEIVHDLEHMGIREPFAEYFENDPTLSSSQKNQHKNSCAKCEFKPEKVFNPLKKHFLKDVSLFYDELKRIARQVETQENNTCINCVKASKSDMIYLFNKLEDLRALVIYKGFQIVI